VILTGLIVPLGFVTLAATFAWTRLALLLARALGFCKTLLLGTVDWFSRIPRASYRIPGPPAWLILAFFAALILFAVASQVAVAGRMSRAARRRPAPPVRLSEWVKALALASLTILVATYPFAPNLARGKLEVSVLDVGQGDSIFAAFPDGRTMLMDGGGVAGAEWIGGHRSRPDVGEEVVSPYLWSRGLKRLDVVALTHAHHDHLDGLHSVLENFWSANYGLGATRRPAHFKVCVRKPARAASRSFISPGARDSTGRTCAARCSGHQIRARSVRPPTKIRLSCGSPTEQCAFYCLATSSSMLRRSSPAMERRSPPIS